MKNIISILFLILFSNRLLAQINCSCNNDMDGDGISGCFDKCPNTPEDVFVDSHGCPMDRDGDGIVDYLDKQLITPTDCQPVDKDGIGVCQYNCPDQSSFGIQDSGPGPYVVYFAPNKSILENYVIKFLIDAAKIIRALPNYKMLIRAYAADGNNLEYEIAWHRINRIKNYLVEAHGIDEERFMYLIDCYGKQNMVEIVSSSDGYESDSKLQHFKR